MRGFIRLLFLLLSLVSLSFAQQTPCYQQGCTTLVRPTSKAPHEVRWIVFHLFCLYLSILHYVYFVRLVLPNSVRCRWKSVFFWTALLHWMFLNTLLEPIFTYGSHGKLKQLTLDFKLRDSKIFAQADLHCGSSRRCFHVNVLLLHHPSFLIGYSTFSF